MEVIFARVTRIRRLLKTFCRQDSNPSDIVNATSHSSEKRIFLEKRSLITQVVIKWLAVSNVIKQLAMNAKNELWKLLDAMPFYNGEYQQSSLGNISSLVELARISFNGVPNKLEM